jgi:predicted Zn-dependent protease
MLKKSMLITFVLFLGLSSQAFAYEYWGPWYDRYEMTGGVSSGKYKNYANDDFFINGQSYDFKTAYDNAMADWNAQTVAAISREADSVYGNEGDYKINMRAAAYGNIDLLGWVEFYVINSDGTYSQTGSLSTGPASDWHFAKSFLNATDIEDGTPLTQPEVEGVATHELGHALGLAHEFDEIAVMDDNEYLTKKWLNVQTDDKNGVNSLY